MPEPMLNPLKLGCAADLPKNGGSCRSFFFFFSLRCGTFLLFLESRTSREIFSAAARDAHTTRMQGVCDWRCNRRCVAVGQKAQRGWGGSKKPPGTFATSALRLLHLLLMQLLWLLFDLQHQQPSKLKGRHQTTNEPLHATASTRYCVCDSGSSGFLSKSSSATISAMEGRSHAVAIDSAVWRSELVACTSALPESSSIRTARANPARAACINGVSPWWLRLAQSTPARMRRPTRGSAALWFCGGARHTRASGESPSQSAVSGAAPDTSSSSRACAAKAKRPRAAASHTAATAVSPLLSAQSRRAPDARSSRTASAEPPAAACISGVRFAASALLTSSVASGAPEPPPAAIAASTHARVADCMLRDAPRGGCRHNASTVRL
eukprot:Rhum_TRINITY_DN14644_c0_g1::Rhum_TRINITY_DN14644_c0_g1_i1::g.105454::m.105454